MPQLDVQVLEEADHERLERLVVASPHGSVFSTPSWARFMSFPHECLGVFKGLEIVGGGVVPVSDGRVSRHVEYTPWTGLVGRREDESECLAIARAVAESLLARYPETTLTLPPEWTDIRPFTWLGMRAHVRYTYRGRGCDGYEKRLRLRQWIEVEERYSSYTEAELTELAPGISICTPKDMRPWSFTSFRAILQDPDEECTITVIKDWRYAYYWKATKGGKGHAECVDAMIRDADVLSLGFDMVGCNSPQRGLFKRAFGGKLTPYFAVTTSDVLDLREPDARRSDLREVSVGTETAYTAGMQAL